LCDAHLDTLFGSQAFLTDLDTATVTLYFDASTYTLIGAQFHGTYGQTAITGNITLSAANGQTTQYFPAAEEISEGTLSEEWQLLQAP
jgi:hypothetical protein